MKRLRAVLVLLLALALIAAFGSVALADTPEQNSADALNYLGLFQGTNSGYALEETLTREQAVTMIVRLLGAEDEAVEKNYAHPFSDVPDWADPYVGYAYANRITSGLSVTVFGAGQAVTEAQFITFLLRVLGYQEGANGDFVWSEPFTLAQSIGLRAAGAPAGALLRGDAAELCWSALKTARQGSTATLGQQLIQKSVFTQTQLNYAASIAAHGRDAAAQMTTSSGSGSSSGGGSSGGSSGGGGSGGDSGGGGSSGGGSSGGSPGGNDTPAIPL